MDWCLNVLFGETGELPGAGGFSRNKRNAVDFSFVFIGQLDVVKDTETLSGFFFKEVLKK